MVHPIVEDGVKWGAMIADDDGYKLYKSYTYRGVEYSTFDTVYSFSEEAKETDIGKICMIWESKNASRVKILWFFRPGDIRNFLGEYRPAWNELFLASGEGVGLSSIVPPEAILGKFNVVCTSRDRRNRLPSKSDASKADYFFSHVFDVGARKLSDKLPDTIASVKVERLLNWGQDKPKATLERPRVVTPDIKTEDGKQLSSSQLQAQPPNNKVNVRNSDVKEDKPKATLKRPGVVTPDIKTEDGKQPSSSQLQAQPPDDKVNVRDSDVKEETFTMFEQLTPENQPLKRRKISEEGSEYILKPKIRASCDEEADVAKGTSFENWRPASDQKYKCQLPWEEEIIVAHEQRRLVTMMNLNPSYTSSDVKDMISFAFKLRVDAKMIPRTSFSGPLRGAAMVIFNSMDEANFVLSELNKRCLVDETGRPFFAFKSNLTGPPKSNKFPGHIKLELHEKKRSGKTKTTSTSHCAQHNTSEYKLAVEWILLHEKTDRWCKALHKEQGKEIASWLNKLKSRQSSECAAVSEGTSKQAVEVHKVKDTALCLGEHRSSQLS